MLYLNHRTLSFKLYLVSTGGEKNPSYFLKLATEFVYCFQIQPLLHRNFCQGIINGWRQGIWLHQMYFDIGPLAVTYSTKTGKSSGKGLCKSGLAPPKSNKSIWIYAGRAESRIRPPLCLTDAGKERATRTSANGGNFATRRNSKGVISQDTHSTRQQQPLRSHEWELHARIEGD